MDSGVGIPGLILLIIIFGLIILFVVSLILFIRRVLTNSTRTNQSQLDIKKRLDAIENKMDLIMQKRDGSK